MGTGIRVELRDRAGNVYAQRDFQDFDDALRQAMSWAAEGFHTQFVGGGVTPPRSRGEVTPSSGPIRRAPSPPGGWG